MEPTMALALLGLGGVLGTVGQGALEERKPLMPRAATRHWAGRLFVLVGLCTLLTGCAATFRSESDLAWWARLGFRPDEPSPAPASSSPNDAELCKNLDRFVWYARDLKEAYRSRATQNRTWIYVAA